MFTLVTERSDGGWCFWVRPWARRSGAGDDGARGWLRAASSAARGWLRAASGAARGWLRAASGAARGRPRARCSWP